MDTRIIWLILLTLAMPAAAFEPSIPVQQDGHVELAGCSVVPGQYSLHHCIHNDPFQAGTETIESSCNTTTAQGGWDGLGWFTILEGSWNSYETCPFLYCDVPTKTGYCYIDWEDNDPESHPGGGEVCHHGRGAEAGPGVRFGCPGGTIHFVCGDQVRLSTTTRCNNDSYADDVSWWMNGKFWLRPDADADDDGVVGPSDYTVLLGCFDENVTPNTEGDFDGDGYCGSSDYTALLANYGRTLSTYTVLGHTQWFYDDRPGPAGAWSGQAGDFHIWMQLDPP